MKALVTGGGGFLGSRIVALLREQGHEVHFLARGQYPDVTALGAVGHQADLADSTAVLEAVAGCDVVFHVAAKAGYWGSLAEYRATNVDGTQNVIDACRKAGTQKLVYTSTPSVTGYDVDLENAPADVPYAAHHASPYPETKAEAERLVLAANGPGLATVALRPHLIFGPGDQHLLPRVVQRARAGKLPIVGTGTNRVDMTYVDNAAWAHLDAAEALTGPGAACAGKAYFISNGEPVALWEWLNALLEALEIPRIRRRVSLRTASLLGLVLELVWRLWPLAGEPRMTRFLALGLARSHWYDMGPAQRELGYRVRVPMSEATERTTQWLKGRA